MGGWACLWDGRGAVRAVGGPVRRLKADEK